MKTLWIDAASDQTGEPGLPAVLALVVAALIVCWIVLRLVLRETVRFSARLGPARRETTGTTDAPVTGKDEGDVSSP